MSEPKIIVSLTTFPTRINKVWIVVECMLRQTYKNTKVILWLSKEQFDGYESLPNNLLRLQRYGLEIRFVDGDLKSHKKYVYTFREYPEDLVFLADDDIIYPSICVEEAYKRYVENGGAKVVIGRWGHCIEFDSTGNAFPYSRWNKESCCDEWFFGSGGGTLLRPSDLYQDVCNDTLFMELTPSADDVWLNAQCRLNGVKVKIYPVDLLRVMNFHDVQLMDENCGNKRNDAQMYALTEYYERKLGRNPFSLNL